MSSFNGMPFMTSAGRMTSTRLSPTHGTGRLYYPHKPVSSNVRRLQEGLNSYLDLYEKEDLVAALNDYHTRRNVVDFVYNLRGILNTSVKRRAILPLLRTILPPSDLDIFDHCFIQQGQHSSKYGTAARGGRHQNEALRERQSNFTYATSTLPSSSKKRYAAKSQSPDHFYQDNVPFSSSAINPGFQSLGRNKTMKSENEIFQLSIPQPPLAQGFGFSIRGGAEYGIGIYVSFVGEGGLAKNCGLLPGDLILEVNNISFRKINHEDAAKVIRCARRLELAICRVGRIPGSYSVHQSYIWMNPLGRQVSPPPELEIIGQAKSGDQRRSSLMLLNAADERKINLFVEEDESLGLMIRGGREFGLGIYVTGVDKHSVAHRAGLQIGDQILNINGQSFLDISHSEAVEVLRDSKHMMLMIKDVGKLPYAKTTIDRTLWFSSEQLRRSQSNRELSNSHRETNGPIGKTAFSRGAGSQLMLNSMATQHWDLIEGQARQLLNQTDQETLRVHVDDYQRQFIRVDELVLSLADLLNTSSKFTLMTEVRNLIHPKDLDQFDARVMKEEVEMLKTRQKYLAHDRFPPGHSDEDSPRLQTTYKDMNFTKHRPDHHASPESSPELHHHSNRPHYGGNNYHDNDNVRMYRSTENITLMKKPPRRNLKINSTVEKLHLSSPSIERSNSDLRDRGQRSSERSSDLQRARSEEHLLVMADVHNGLYSISKPLSEMKAPTEGDSGVYMNGSSTSDSSSPSSIHTEVTSGLYTQTHQPLSEMKAPTEGDSGVYMNGSSTSDSSSPSSIHTEVTSGLYTQTHQTETTESPPSIHNNNSGPPKMDESNDDWEMWREKYGDIPMEPTTVYKSQPTLGLAIEGGANTRQPLPRVISVQPGGSAYESGGVKVGHVILEVNGRCLVGMEHKDAARAIAEAFKSKSVDRMDLLVTDSDTDVKAVLQRHKKNKTS